MEKIKELFIKNKEVILYVFFGGCTTVVNYIVHFACELGLGLHYDIATIISWIVAVFFAYITNKLWVFESKSTDVKTLVKEILSFFGARVVTLIMELIVMTVGVEVLGINSIFVKLFGQVLVIIANYFFSKLFIFKKKAN